VRSRDCRGSHLSRAPPLSLRASFKLLKSMRRTAWLRAKSWPREEGDGAPSRLKLTPILTSLFITVPQLSRHSIRSQNTWRCRE